MECSPLWGRQTHVPFRSGYIYSVTLWEYGRHYIVSSGVGYRLVSAVFAHLLQTFELIQFSSNEFSLVSQVMPLILQYNYPQCR